MGQNSLINIEKIFQWKSVSRKYMDIFEEIDKREAN